MIGLTIVPLAGAAPQPWRNGGGVTRELLAWPAPAAWTLRISVAQIGCDGPFSAFADVERWFAVVHGAGVTLQFDGGCHTLTVGSAPLCFDGAAPPACTLTGGPTEDLNLMLRRQAGHGAMQCARPGVDWCSPAALRALYCSGPAQLQINGRHVADLAAAALVWHPYAAGQTWRIHAANATTLAWWMSFDAQPRRP